MELYEEIIRLKREGRPSALAIIIQCLGSSPQKAGSKMLVRDDGSIMGTLGGGCMEAEVIQASLMAVRDGSPLTTSFELTEKHGGLVCGGKVLVYIEPVLPEPRLIILGAGHVGRALSKVAGFSGFRVTVIDDRAEYADRKHLPDADDVLVNDFKSAFDKVPREKNSYVVIATRGHNHDLEAVIAALKTDVRYIGLVGSKRKRSVLFHALTAEGFSEEDTRRVVIPVGLPIGSVSPEEIAISIMAQIIQYRRENAASGLVGSSCSGRIEEDGTGKAAPALG
ncbi:MAG: XdhC/CoxI family protein [Thermodesulfovibrionales bacterium]|jgi:xanthine dehydrogenase accessory factor